jgi:diguanylate cyclase (GGDEF)-like protein/PAS domain S-box-containing protein
VSSRVLITGYLLTTAVLTAGFYALPDLHMALWSSIAVLSAVAIAVGIRRNRPRRSLGWWLLFVSTLTFGAGDTTYNVLTVVLHQPHPFPSYADIFYWVTFILQNAGMIALAWSMTAGRDKAGILDSLIFTLGVGLLYWIFLINPYLQNSSLTLIEKIVSISYPLTDVLLLATASRVVGVARRSPSVVLLAIGCAGLLTSDIVYGLGQLGGSWQIGGPIDLGWIVLYAGWGMAALHPSMRALAEPRVLRQGQVGAVRLTVLALSSLIAPAVLFVEAARARVTDGLVIAAFSTVMFLLVMTRLAGVVQRHREALSRERGLREAGTTLVSATDVAAVAGAVRVSLAALLPSGTPHHVVFEAPDATSASVGTGMDMVPTAELDPAAAAHLGDFPVALRCPLALSDRPVGDRRVGSLLVAAAEPVLVSLQPPVEALAAQAALALERIALSDEINRRTSEEYFRTLVLHTPDMIMIVDDDNRIRYASPSAAPVFGTEALVGVSLAELVEPSDRLVAVQLLDLVRSGGYRTGAVDWRLPCVDGSLMHVEVACRDLRHDRTVRGLVVTLRDVTERRRLERELTLRLFQDSLTGLANRVLFQERVRQAVARSHRTGQAAGVLLIDLDDFKEINETLGHAAGDELLVAVGHRLADALGSEHTTARLGGDEFAALVEDVLDPVQLEQIAERVIGALAEPLRVGDSVVHSGASVGVAMAVDATDGEDLLRQADLALYAAKGAVKGSWRRYVAELHTAVVERIQLRVELERAVANHEFTLHYQPIVALDSGMTVGFEALVRWEHPNRGVLGPGHFIAAAEETGLIVPIGTWVLSTSIQVAADWYKRRDGDGTAPYVSVNVSARQFRTPGFVELVRQELAAAGLPPCHLMLEITESLLLRDDEQVWPDLQELRDIGVRVAIDDFGTGYSSLSYLQQVPIDVLKVDKSFIDTASSSPRQRALVECIVRLADTIGLSVVAEGIEQQADRELLSSIGCPYGQGYLFAGPLRYEDAVQWLFSDRLAA